MYKGIGVGKIKKEEKLDNKSNLARLAFISRFWRILGVLILVLTVGGCIGRESKVWNGLPDVTLPAQNISEDDQSLAQDVSKISEPTMNMVTSPNHIRLNPRYEELNSSGKLPVTLEITNPTPNATVLIAFKSQFAQEWGFANQTRITTPTNKWIQNYSIRFLGNTSYVLMFVQISENNTILRRGIGNITLEAPVGRP